jgi:hypothetical protein
MLNLEKLFLEAGKKNKAENVAHLKKDVFFSKNDTFTVFRIFRPKGSILLRLKTWFSCSAAHPVPNDVKKLRKKKFYLKFELPAPYKTSLFAS